jgi:hypothetical protein
MSTCVLAVICHCVGIAVHSYHSILGTDDSPDCTMSTCALAVAFLSVVRSVVYSILVQYTNSSAYQVDNYVVHLPIGPEMACCIFLTNQNSLLIVLVTTDAASKRLKCWTL